MRPGRYLLLLAAFGSQRLIELGYSMRNERRMRSTGRVATQAAASSFKWIVLTNVALFSVPAIERYLKRDRPVPVTSMAIGWFGALAGAALRLSVIASLGPAWNARALVPSELPVVDRGPYRLIRHPNYVALGMEFLGLPLIGGAYYSAAGLSLLNAWLLSTRIREEERLLMASAEYRLRMAAKPRFVPRFTNH